LKNFKIANVVATADVGIRLDLKQLSKDLTISYNPRKYHGIVAYFKDSQTHGRVSIFASGKLISVGTKSEKQAQEDITRTMTKLGITPNEGIKTLVVRNIVATTDLGYDINLEEIRGGIYEPEQFPGVILQSKTNPRVKILLFASGKAVMVGLQNTSEIPKIIEEIKSFIK
jgi:TATA-box binding protein (TBP) (component of TFIID and TFIIIB)